MTEFTLRQLRHFLAIAGAGSFSSAARELHLSASALAGSLDELERSLGVVLCVRRKAHGIQLTADGRHLRGLAAELLRHADDVSLAVVTSDKLSGPLVVGCYSTLAPTVIPELVEGFSALHPSVRLDVLEARGDELQLALDDGRIDAAILYDRDIDGDYATSKLYEMRPHVLLAATHPLAWSTSVSLADLAAEPMVLLDLAPSAQHTLGLLAAAGVSPRIAHRTSSYELTRAFVGRGLGFAILVQRTRAGVSYEGRQVVIKEISPAPPAVAVVLARTHGNRRNARITALREFATEHSDRFHAPL